MNFDKNYRVTITGGYDQTLTTITGVTTLKGSVTISNGTVTIGGAVSIAGS